MRTSQQPMPHKIIGHDQNVTSTLFTDQLATAVLKLFAESYDPSFTHP
jgi:hypothetical protein